MANFPTNATITFTAKAATGSSFVRWTGCAANPTPRQCTVILTTDKVVTATFSQPVLIVRKVGSGLVATVGASGIFCGADCVEPYNLNAKATLVAIPAVGFRFGSWNGCTADPTFPQMCTVTLDQSKTVTTHFIR